MVICWNTESATGTASWEPEHRLEEGTGETERPPWRGQAWVTEMQKKTDGEILKMMQLQIQIVKHTQT